MSGLDKAIAAFGTATALGKEIGVSVQAIWNWKAREAEGKKGIPAERCPTIERVTRERGTPVHCEELRPDVEWAVLRQCCKKKR